MSSGSTLRRYNPVSVLRNINLADAEEVNKAMHYLARCLDKSGNIAGSKRIAEQALATIDKGPIQRIVTAIERNVDQPLLKMAIERLLQVRDRTRLEILGAVSEIEHLAEEKVLLNPTVWHNEYVQALERFLQLPPLEFVELPGQKRKSKDEGDATKRSKKDLSGETVVAQSSDQLQTEIPPQSTGTPEIKSKPVRKRLPSYANSKSASSALPNSQLPRIKADPTTSRRKRPVEISQEHAPSPTPEAPVIAPKKRGKSPKACNECRRRKIKCLKDDGEASCVSCIKLSRDCVFCPPSTSKSVANGSLKRSATEDPVEIPTKKRAMIGGSKSGMKNILRNFDDLGEGRALGIVAEADDEDSGEGLGEIAEVMEVNNVLQAKSDTEDFDYKPSKRALAAQKSRSRPIRKPSVQKPSNQVAE